jgi:hypothetical protein
MTWVFQLLGSQLLFAYILTTVLFLLWKAANKGSKDFKTVEEMKSEKGGSQ